MGLAHDFVPVSYRVFLRDAHGHIQNVIELDCNGDDEGRLKARELKGAAVVELWQAARLVARFDGDGKDLPVSG
jgi:hypothetical protein